MNNLSSAVQLQLKCHIAVSRAMSLLLDSGISLRAIESSCPIPMIIDASLSRMKELESEYAPLEGLTLLSQSGFHS